jgi:hypothetical protein
MIWNIFCYIFGIVAIVGPICLVFWYSKAAKQRLSDMSKNK